MVWGVSRGIDDILARVRDNDASLPSLYLVRARKFEEPEARALCDAISHNTVLQDLNISSHAVTPAMAALFAALLRSSTALRSLDLGNSTFGDAGLAALCPGVAASPSLRRLSLEGKGITAAGCAPLSDALLENNVLQQLTLARNDIGNGGLTTLCTALAKLHQVSLAACSLTGSEAGTRLSSILSTSLTLQSIHLEDNALDAASITAMAPGLSASTSLTKLHLRGCSLGTQGVRTLFNNISGFLIYLDISGTDAGSDGIKAAAASLAAGGAPALRRLLACGCGADDASIAALIIALNKGLNKGSDVGFDLDVSGNEVGYETVAAVACCSALRTLCLHDCKLGSTGCSALCTELRALGENTSSANDSLKFLHELDLSGNHLEASDLVTLLDTLRKCPAVCPALQQLVLAANPGAMEPEVIAATEAVQGVRPGLDIVRRSADTGERDGQHTPAPSGISV